jgi:Ca-activated chloride channel family protein
MSFGYPWVLWALAAVFPYIVFSVAQFHRSGGALPPAMQRRVAASAVFFGLFLVSLIIALASPRRGGMQPPGTGSREADIVIALDVSRSMDITDSTDRERGGAFLSDKAGLSRLQQGVSLARETAARLPDARFAAAVGRSRALLTVPLTRDYSAIVNFLDAVDSGFFTGRGTNLEALLDAAAGAFQDSSPSRRYILLVSDGEALSGSFKSAVERCKRDNIAIIALALGSDAGRPVHGQEHLTSSRDLKTMRMAADLTGGLYVDGNQTNAQEIAGYVRSHSPLRHSGADDASRWFIFIIIAIVCYGASRLCVLDVRKKRMAGLNIMSRLCAAVYLPVLLCVTAALCASCNGISGKLLIMEGNYHSSGGRYTRAISSYQKALSHDDAAPYAQAGLGTVFYHLDEAKAAQWRFEDSLSLLDGLPLAEHTELRYRNSYNSGVSQFAQGDFSGAAASFRQALRIDPSRIDAKRNLELSLLSAAREQTAGAGYWTEEIQNKAVLFDYLGRAEQNRWRSREWTTDEQDEGPDY